MKTALRWLVSNLGLILLSLILGLFVWTAAVREGNPTIQDRYATRIPVTLSEPPEGMIAYGDTNALVYVTLRAPESVWQNLQPDDIRAMVDLSNLGEGTHRAPVQVEIAQQPTRVERIEPEAITIHLESERQVSLSINVNIEGNTALGYIAHPPEINPLTVTVSGPASFVDQVTTIAAQVSVESERADLDGEFELLPYDINGQIVRNVELFPSFVAVHMQIEQLRGFRDLGVTAPLSGTVAPGYRVSNITVEPPVVTVFGRQDAIDQIPGQLSTTLLNIEGATESIEMDLPLMILEGVSLIGVENPLITVQVVIVPQEGSTTVQRVVEIQRLSPGITATVAPTMVQVILSGPLPVLEQLQEADVQVIVDLVDLGPGTYSIEPLIAKPPDIVVDSTLPASIQVELTTAPTPTSRR